MSSDLLECLTLIILLHDAIVAEEHALEDMIVGEMERRNRVQIPAEHSQQVEFAALDGSEARVRTATSETRALLRLGEKEATIKTVADEAMPLAHLLDQWYVIINFVEFRSKEEAC